LTIENARQERTDKYDHFRFVSFKYHGLCLKGSTEAWFYFIKL